MKNKKQIFLAVMMLWTIVLFLLSGCKPKRIISEKLVIETDSAAVLNLQDQLTEQKNINENLRLEIRRFAQENSKLQSEASTHTINYDTSAQVNPETGKYPIANETISQRKSFLEKENKELKDVKAEDDRTIKSQQQLITNLEYIVEQYMKKEEESKLKTVPTAGFNFRLAMFSFAIGLIVGVLLWCRFGRKIRKLIFPFVR